MPGSAYPFWLAYKYALTQLWAKSILVFLWFSFPFIIARLLFIGWVWLIAQNSPVLFFALFCLFASVQVYLFIHFIFVMPLFVDHPTYSPPVLLRISYDLVQNNIFGIVRFSICSLLLILVGILALIIGSFFTTALVYFALAFAYKDILGVYTWSQHEKFAWTEHLPGGLASITQTAGIKGSAYKGVTVPSFADDDEEVNQV